MLAIRDRVRFGETDKMGIVYHPNYFPWMEMGRVEYLRSCGVELEKLLDEGITFPIGEVRATFKNTMTFDDEFEVRTTMSAFNKAKMEFTYQIVRLRDGAVAVEGFTRNVFTDGNGRVIRLPGKWYEKIKAVYDKEQKLEE